MVNPAIRVAVAVALKWILFAAVVLIALALGAAFVDHRRTARRFKKRTTYPRPFRKPSAAKPAVRTAPEVNKIN
jgi:hypothetical protein